MEARKITVVSTITQRTYVFMSEAETLGQLKNDLDREGIAYDDMTFYEGVSKSTLEDDASILPTNIPYRGGRTNELSFLLTRIKEKTNSGMDRNSLYNFIKNNECQEDIKKKFGRNYTNCTTRELEDFYKNFIRKPLESEEENIQDDNSISQDSILYIHQGLAIIKSAIRDLFKDLYGDDLITLSEKNRMISKLDTSKDIKNSEKLESSFSQKELDEMFRGRK